MKKLVGLTLGALMVSGAVLAASPGGWGDCADKREQSGASAMQHRGQGDFSPRMAERLSRELGLSDAQRQQVGELLADKAGFRDDKRDERKVVRAEMMALDPAASDYLDQVAALADRQSQKMAARMVEHAQLHAELYALLTPEQQQRFIELREQRGKHGGGHHRH